MMDRRQQKEWTQALVFLSGDRRDWPLMCEHPDCHSGDIVEDYMKNAYFCNTCRRWTSKHIAHELREELARKDVMRGVGGPLVEVCEQRRKGETAA